MNYLSYFVQYEVQVTGIVAIPIAYVALLLTFHCKQTIATMEPEALEPWLRQHWRRVTLCFFVAVTVGGPIFEEAVFRGPVVALKQIGVEEGVTVTVGLILLVAFVYVHTFGRTSLEYSWRQYLRWGLPGLGLLIISLTTTRLWPAMVAHGLYNLGATIYVYRRTWKYWYQGMPVGMEWVVPAMGKKLSDVVIQF